MSRKNSLIRRDRTKTLTQIERREEDKDDDY